MAGRFDDNELLWIRETLDQHGEFLCDLLRETIEQKNLIKEGVLEESVDYKTGSYGLNPHLEISFMSYGRAIEIDYFKGSKNKKSFLMPGQNLRKLATRNNPKQFKKKDTRWYAKIVYGSMNRLIGIIMYELSDTELARIKNIIELQKVAA